MAFAAQAFVDAPAESPAAIMAASDLVRSPIVHALAVMTSELLEHSPPDVQVLNSTFLI